MIRSALKINLRKALSHVGDIFLNCVLHSQKDIISRNPVTLVSQALSRISEIISPKIEIPNREINFSWGLHLKIIKNLWDTHLKKTTNLEIPSYTKTNLWGAYLSILPLSRDRNLRHRWTSKIDTSADHDSLRYASQLTYELLRCPPPTTNKYLLSNLHIDIRY